MRTVVTSPLSFLFAFLLLLALPTHASAQSTYDALHDLAATVIEVRAYSLQMNLSLILAGAETLDAIPVLVPAPDESMQTLRRATSQLRSFFAARGDPTSAEKIANPRLGRLWTASQAGRVSLILIGELNDFRTEDALIAAYRSQGRSHVRQLHELTAVYSEQFQLYDELEALQ